MSEKYSQSPDGLRAKLESAKAMSAALGNAAKRSWEYSKSQFEFALKQGGITEPIVLSYGSARSGPDSPEYGQAVVFNKELAERGWVGRSGGGNGIMEAAGKGMAEGGSRLFGVNILLPWEQKPNAYVDKKSLVTAKQFPERMELLRSGNVQGIAVFRGGIGTIQEFADILGNWNTKKIDALPMAFVDKKFWEPFKKQLETLIEDGKLGPEILDPKNVIFTDSAEEAAAFIDKRSGELRKERAERAARAQEVRIEARQRALAAIPGMRSVQRLRRTRREHVDAQTHSENTGPHRSRSRGRTEPAVREKTKGPGEQ